MRHARSDYNSRIVDLENKIPQDEPVFLLRGQDKLAPRLLLTWAMELRLAGGDPEMARSAEDHAQEMIKWQATHECKTPDMYRDSESKHLLKENIIKILNEGSIKDIRKLTEMVTEYYGNGKDYITILMRSELNPQFLYYDFDNIYSIDQFIDIDSMQISKSKLVIFVDKTRFKVIMNKL